MQSNGHRGWLFRLAILVGVVSLAPPALAAEQVIFDSQQYIRTSGPPNQFLETIPLPQNLTSPFRLHVRNGNPDGTNRISIATITLNGAQVAGPSDFSQQVTDLDRTVTLQAYNALQVRLTSAPPGSLTLTLFGTVPPPTLAKLEPPSLPITQGGTGILTATIGATQSSPTTISLQSSNPAVATVPATATVPAEQLTATVPVAAGSPGTAMITATLNGSSVASTIRVAPAGPTLTKLFPATLQVTQGAAGMLTVTISAAQATDTLVTLTSSNASSVGLPPSGGVNVPAGQTAQVFTVFGVGQGTATITAHLNNTTVESQVAVVAPLPSVVSLLPPVLPLTEGSMGTLTVTLNASQPTDTEVFLSTSDATVVTLPGDRVTVPANRLTATIPVTGRTRGTATVTVSLNGTTAASGIEVQPPPPTIQELTCPASLTVGATGLCTVSLNATQLAETLVPLGASATGVLSIPASVPVPANTLTAQFAVTGLAQGSGTLMAGPLNGTSKDVVIQVLPPPPMIVSLTPRSATVLVGATVTLTLTLNAAQLTDTAIPLAGTPPGIINTPAGLTVPAGSLSVPVTVTGLALGSATLMAGPLNGTQAQSSLTVNQLPPTVTTLAPASLTLPKGKAGTLTLTIAPTQSDPTVVLLTSSEPSVEVPSSLTIPAGSGTVEFPVIARSEGTATVTAGPLNGTSQTITVTVTPAELITLTIMPPAPTIAKGQTQPFTATGPYTDATTRDLTGEAIWSSENPTVATITSPGGLASGLREGQATITATVGTMNATASLTVTPPILASIAITPTAPSVVLGRTVQLTALGTLTDGTNQDVATQITWTSGDPTIATVSATGLVTPVLGGSVTITATHADGFTATTTLTVVLAPPTLTGFSPSGGSVGTLVTLMGTNLDLTTRITFNGFAAAFTIRSATQLTATVPAGATTGLITVTTPGGAVASLGSFTILVPPTLTITSPTDGAALSSDRTLVKGTLSAGTTDVGVTINGTRALVAGSQWVAEIPLFTGINELVATATDAMGTTATTRIAVTVSQLTSAPLILQAVPASGVTPLTVTWQILNQTGRKLVQYQFDPTGSGSFGSPASSFDGVQSTYSTPGLYLAVLRATDDQGTPYVATAAVSVVDRAALDGILQARWTGLKASLMAGDASAALQHFLEHERDSYAALFSSAVAQLQALGADMPTIQPVYFTETVAKYRLRRQQQVNGTLMRITHYVYFSVDADGTWRIDSF
jgi:uncharacterized protein YjdB